MRLIHPNTMYAAAADLLDPSLNPSQCVHPNTMYEAVADRLQIMGTEHHYALAGKCVATMYSSVFERLDKSRMEVGP